MLVSKWGSSLPIRLPAEVVQALELKEGDEIEISIARKCNSKVARDYLARPLPPGFKFDREELNER